MIILLPKQLHEDNFGSSNIVRKYLDNQSCCFGGGQKWVRKEIHKKEKEAKIGKVIDNKLAKSFIWHE